MSTWNKHVIELSRRMDEVQQTGEAWETWLLHVADLRLNGRQDCQDAGCIQTTLGVEVVMMWLPAMLVSTTCASMPS
jgi:hypothetical protein